MGEMFNSNRDSLLAQMYFILLRFQSLNVGEKYSEERQRLLDQRLLSRSSRWRPETRVVLQNPVTRGPAVRGTGTVTLPSQTVIAAVSGPLLVTQ